MNNKSKIDIQEKAILVTFLQRVLKREIDCQTTLLQRKTFISILEKLQD